MFYKLDTIVFSKDRAAQLDLFLDSFSKNFAIGKVTVIYTYSSEEFRDGYIKLRKKHGPKWIDWFNQGHLTTKQALYRVLNDCEDMINLCTDDTVYYRPKVDEDFDEIDLKYILKTDNNLCFSPRLGLNTIVQDYRTGELQSPLTDYIDGHYYNIYWNWTKLPPLRNYGFACHQDSYICHIDDFLKIAQFDWKTMRELEGGLALERRHTMYYKPMMASPVESWCVNVPANNVLAGLHHGQKCYESLEDMNKKFLDGQHLSLEKSDFSNIVGCHQEVKLEWV
jgi:hypothetical protein